MYSVFMTPSSITVREAHDAPLDYLNIGNEPVPDTFWIAAVHVLFTLTSE